MCEEEDIDSAAYAAAVGGHTDVLDLLASEFGAEIGLDNLVWAARRGHDAMIDHLVEKYGVDPNGMDDYGRWTALHRAARFGRVRTIKHLVEKHNVDIHQRIWNGETVLDQTERLGMTECAAVLRGYGATNGEPVEDENEEDEEDEEDWTESDDWETDDNSDADHDVM